jgi:hypothetical protein
MDLKDLTEVLGGAGIAFYVMWLWLQSVRKERNEFKEDLKTERDERISEIKELMPLLDESSKCIKDLAITIQGDNKAIVDKISDSFNKLKCKHDARNST